MDAKKLEEFLMKETEFDHSVVNAIKGNQDVNAIMARTLEVQKIKTSAALGVATVALSVAIFIAMTRR